MFFYVPPPLNPTLDISFKPEDSILNILKKGMIDNTTVQWSYSSFFERCGATYCTYTISGYQNIITIVTTSIGIASGISVVLQLLVPLLIHVGHWCLRHMSGK